MERTQQIPKLNLEIPQSFTMSDLYKFLQRQSSFPFKNFFLTNKPAANSHFAQERTIKSIRSECQQLQNHIVLLCYQSKVNPVIQEKKNSPVQKPSSQVEPYFQTQTRATQQLKKKRKKSDDCVMM